MYQCFIPDPQNYGFGISIEMMYPEEDIKIFDENNRRLYLTNEFNVLSGTLIDDHSIICRNNALKDAYKNHRVKIIDSDIISSDSETNIALTKDNYASNILNRTPPFDNVNVDGFRELFNTIREIIED